MIRLFTTILASLSLTLSGAAAASLSEKQIAPNVRMIRLAENVYSFTADNTTADIVDGNSTLILTDDGAVVVDAPSAHLVRLHIAEIKKLTNKPVRYLINTHWHSDHTIGDGAYKKAFPGVEIISDDYTAEIWNRRGPALFEKLVSGEEGEALLATFEKNAGSAVDDDGNPKSAYQSGRDARAARDLKRAFESAAKTGFAGVERTFSDAMTLTLGGTEIRLKKFTGHSRGDTVVFLPEEKILITGDLVIHPTPYGINSEFRSWPETLDALLAYDARIIVPGHGDMQYSKDYMLLQQRLIRALRDQANKAVAERRKLEEFQAEIDLEEFRIEFAGDDPDLNWAWKNYFLDPALPVVFNMAGGTR
ncbi:MAG: MBL fold metallo-hydrolase [Parvularculaceae bacterium]|nr:MBL fold metallo-hydrolase [Parvularculaceae bacterium]